MYRIIPRLKTFSTHNVAPRRFPSVIPRLYANMSAPQAAETDAQAAQVASQTGVTAASIQKKLEDAVGAQHVDIEDMSGASISCLLSAETFSENQPHWPKVGRKSVALTDCSVQVAVVRCFRQ